MDRGSKVDTTQLTYLVTLAEERHFLNAANRLSISQSSLSQHIQRIEREVGVRLFNRTTRHVELTPAGELLVERARAVLADLEVAFLDARELAQGRVGTLRIGLTGSAIYGLVPRLIRRFRKMYPEIDIALQPELLTSQQVPALVEGRLDIGLVRPPAAVGGWSVEVIDEEPMLALLPDSHPAAEQESLDLRTLRREQFVMFRGSSESRVNQVVTSACRSAGFDPIVGQNVSMTSAVVGLVSAGLGVALVPRSVQQVRAEGVAYVRIDHAPVIRLAICWRSSGSTPAAERFVRFVTDHVKQRDSGPPPP